MLKNKKKSTFKFNVNKIKDSRGVTLITLVITIIVMTILASVSIYEANISLNGSESKILKSELGIVQNAVMQTYYKKALTNEELPGIQYNEENKNEIEEIINKMPTTEGEIQLKDTNYTNYYLLQKEHLELIGITDTDDEFIVNYLTGEVINKTKIVTKDNEPLYIYNKTLK